MISLDILNEFLSVAKHLSFTIAAKELFITQSTLSRHISALEAEMGVVLFKRNKRHVQLTSAGQILQEDGARIIMQMRDMENRVVSADKGILGSLIVACAPNYADVFFPAYMSYRSAYPDVYFNIIHRTALAMHQCIIERELADVGFMPVFPDTAPDFGKSDNIETQILFRDRLCVLTSLTHPLVSKGYVELGDLENGKLLSFHSNVSSFLTWCYLRAGRVARIKEIRHPDAPEGLMLNIKSSDYIALHSDKIALEQQIVRFSDCAFLEIRDIDTSFDVVAIKRKDNKNPTLSNFLAILSELFGSRDV